MTVYDFKTDEELVDEIKQGEITAFEELVRRYEQRLVAFVFHIIENLQDAEDIVSEVLFKVYKTIDRVDIQRKFSSYVYQIAKNDAISYLRGKKYEISLEELEVIDSDESVYEKLAKSEDAEMVKQAIRKLEKKYQLVIKLYYFEELSYEEIGKKLALPVNTVRTHLRRAKESLRRYLIHEKS